MRWLRTPLVWLLSISGCRDSCEICVTTETGVVRGAHDGEVLAFKNIPYAAPPIGPQRFRPPAPPPGWQGIRNGTDFGAVCPQLADPLEHYPRPATTAPNPLTGQETQFFDTEDCLTVNVWTPATDGAKRPVMLFIHGGAFQVGSASSEFYTGRHLAKHDVVVITANYRLGALGFLELGGLDSSYRGSGNNGLRDQLAAIAWTHRNAAAFGGDPDNLTVFGESAGSIAVSALLATQAPERLFRRAIGQSGGPNLLHTAAFQEEATTAYRNAGPKRTLNELLGASTRDLLMQQDQAVSTAPLGDALFAPYVDGGLILGNVDSLIAAGHAGRVDLVVGATQDEMGYWALYDSQLRNPFVETTDRGEPTPLVPASARAAADAALRPSSLEQVYRRWIAETGAPLAGRTLAATVELTQAHDLVMILPMTRLAERQVVHNPRTYLYRFQWRVPRVLLSSNRQDVGAIHALELPFVFGTLALERNVVPGGPRILADSMQLASARALADGMMRAWTNFAKTGDPNGPGVPHWPPFNLTTRPALVWRNDSTGTLTSGAVEDPDATRRAAWASWSFPPFPWR